MTEEQRLTLIIEAIRYCRKVKALCPPMPPRCYTKALREPIFYLWDLRNKANKETAPCYRSEAAKGKGFGTHELVYDHAIPFIYVQTELLHLDDDVTTPEEVRAVLLRLEIPVLITTEENARLRAAKLHCKMPKGWNATRADVDRFGRYEAVSPPIKLLENTPEVWSLRTRTKHSNLADPA